MDSITEVLERVFAVLLLPSTLYGAGGALMHARRKGKPIGQSLAEVLGGAFTAHMLTGAITNNIPPDWCSVAFFLVGWGGLEFVGRAYEAAEAAVVKRLSKKIGGE